ncbi:MAG: LysM domain-containing protein [Hydrogenoanaerobacterium sp.]
MLREVIFKGGGRELALPVTPESFALCFAVRSETINIYAVGDADVAGQPLLDAPKLNFILTAQDYPFANAEYSPYEYIAIFKKWVRRKTVLRYIVPDTDINLPVRITSIDFGEKDGTNDVYGTIAMREHRTLEAVQITDDAALANKTRSEGASTLASDLSYTIQYGDTMCAICRRYYGNDKPATYNALAKYNGIANANIIMAGRVINVPEKAKLGV